MALAEIGCQNDCLVRKMVIRVTLSANWEVVKMRQSHPGKP
jgi:hypothetical protein